MGIFEMIIKGGIASACATHVIGNVVGTVAVAKSEEIDNATKARIIGSASVSTVIAGGIAYYLGKQIVDAILD